MSIKNILNDQKLTDSVNFCAELDKPLIYFPNNGNLGDALITTGAKMAFDKLGVSFQPIESINKIPDAVLIYGGGGNLVPYYKECSRFLSAALRRPNTVVLLPHTVSGHSNLIQNLNERFHIFCREKPSYQYVSKFQTTKTYLDDDLALRINPEILFSNYSIDIRKAPNEIMWAIEIILRKSILHSKSHRRTGFLFRTDKESAVTNIKDTFDISSLFIKQWGLTSSSTLISSAFLMGLSMFDRIYTDRLHVAIGASILKIPTTLYPGSYYKNEAVFESSIKKLSSCVKFEANPSFVL